VLKKGTTFEYRLELLVRVNVGVQIIVFKACCSIVPVVDNNFHPSLTFAVTVTNKLACNASEFITAIKN
jgi:hypothetical protein